ncbi:O-acetyl-ADP-ribose deacetylase [Xylocopilactobacillus apicola]|uniref:Macro domain-containing protein n=1 Tax=Xylocopilactobacillus apicola TaxID=2932184 RepID=A0AAU9D3X7_9LACO|nr:O-acetyl-ADP-ribose deacetylase [Xylocopilactobacillus apicola]BDR59541.1 macro domain-containing protein [Xylocopilactobacillus apicola]
MIQIEIIKGDITQSHVDAIVNAANTTLMGGGGVDGAIHCAAGPELDAACEALHGCKTGEAKTTPGFNLPAKFIIHTPGPIWHDGKNNEDELLKNSYFNSLKEAEAHQCHTVDFPSISTGVYHFPLLRAAKIALNTISNFPSYSIEKVRIVAFDLQTKAAYDYALTLS